MQDLMKNIFPFDEDNEIKLKIKLYLREQGCSSIIVDAAIRFNGYIISLYTLAGNSIRSNIHLFYNKVLKKDDISIKKAMVRGMEIIVIRQPLFFTQYASVAKSIICSLNFKSIEYRISNSSNHHYYRLSDNAKFLEGYLTRFIVKDDKVVGTKPGELTFSLYKSNRYALSYDGDKVFLKLESGSDPKIFLAIASFFSSSPIEILMENNNGTVRLYEPHYKICLNRKEDNQQLTYLFCKGQCLDYFTDFLNLLSNISQPADFDNLCLYIEYYVRAEYLDEVSKLVLYTSILAKFSNVNRGEDTDKAISRFLMSNHLSFDKINCKIIDENINNSEGKPIDNFVKLRNFFVHQLGNQKAVDFLRNSDMLFNLKMATTILILKKLGIREVHFDKHFHEISIFEDSYSETDSLKKYMNEQEL